MNALNKVAVDRIVELEDQLAEKDRIIADLREVLRRAVMANRRQEQHQDIPRGSPVEVVSGRA